ncbi:MAG: alpha/beta hydrolase [Burkholderiales bacterium]|nr:alpha/beta hydrolase [Burkholderiales bacterium]
MNPATRRTSIAGPAGAIEVALDGPEAPAGVAVLCHPHPLHGGTMDNKVVQTMARAFVQRGWLAVRFNFRGIGASAGAWDEGRGEVDDALAVVAAFRHPALPLALGGFSFGGSIAASAAAATPCVGSLVLIAPAVKNFSTPTASEPSLVIHGEADDVVPLAAVLDWARPQSLPVTVIPGAGHFFHGQLPLLKHLIVGALSRSEVPR